MKTAHQHEKGYLVPFKIYILYIYIYIYSFHKWSKPVFVCGLYATTVKRTWYFNPPPHSTGFMRCCSVCLSVRLSPTCTDRALAHQRNTAGGRPAGPVSDIMTMVGAYRAGHLGRTDLFRRPQHGPNSLHWRSCGLRLQLYYATG